MPLTMCERICLCFCGSEPARDDLTISTMSELGGEGGTVGPLSAMDGAIEPYKDDEMDTSCSNGV